MQHILYTPKTSVRTVRPSPRNCPAYKLPGTLYSYCMMFYTIRKKKCSPLSWYKAIFVWFSQFIMTVVQNEATLREKRWPWTGSSPKTAVKVLMTEYMQLRRFALRLSIRIATPLRFSCQFVALYTSGVEPS